MQFALYSIDFTSMTSHIYNWMLFLLWLHLFILSGVTSPLISSIILGTYQTGEFIFQCHTFLLFHTVPRGGDRIRVELFQIPKNDAVKVLYSICQQIWKTQQWPQDWRRSVFIPVPKKGYAKECPNYHTIVLISHASQVMLKILQRLQQYMNWELTDVQAGFRKGRVTRDQIANILCIVEKASKFHKNIHFCFIDYTKAFDCGSQQPVENS